MRGNALLASVDVVSARLYFEQAANAGDGRAAMLMGATYDPAFLDRAGARGMRGDTAYAATWYRRARDLGKAEAANLLTGLDAK
jgi:TPR repeat protein